MASAGGPDPPVRPDAIDSKSGGGRGVQRPRGQTVTGLVIRGHATWGVQGRAVGVQEERRWRQVVVL